MSKNTMPSELDPGQIIKRSFDDPNDAIRTSIVAGSITVNELAIGQQGNPAPPDVKVAGGVDDSGNAQPIHVNSSGDTQVDVVSSVLPTGAATEATLAMLNLKTAGALVPVGYDYLDISYVGASTDISTVVYKTGGSGGTTVATLTLGYDGSDRLTSVTKT